MPSPSVSTFPSLTLFPAGGEQMGSILTDTKSTLGLASDAAGYDAELIIFINGVLSELTQLGIGPDAGSAISSDVATWDTFLGSDPRLNDAKLVMHLGVKLVFDPPSEAPVLMSMEKLRNEAMWRLNVAREEIVYPPVSDVIDEDMVLDGGEI